MVLVGWVGLFSAGVARRGSCGSVVVHGGRCRSAGEHVWVHVWGKDG